MRRYVLRALENLRYSLFWSLDRLKGGNVKKHYKDIRFILEQFESSYSKQKRDDALKMLLEHAVKTTVFYKNYKHAKTVQDFPVINKTSIREHKKNMLSQAFSGKKIVTVKTSGSTGATLEIVQDSNKKQRNTADTLYFSELAGFKLGYKLYYVRLWVAYLKKQSIQIWKQNIHPVNVIELNDAYLKKLIEHIKTDPSRKGWLGYASGFEAICKYLDKIKTPPINTNVTSIIAISESLNDYTKQSMSRYFGAPTVSRYSNWENGIIAQQMPDGTTDFKINWASYLVEILEFDTNNPVKEGQLGRIVITDLFNYALPMIRYDTGDVGAMDTSVSPPVLKKVEGRQSDIVFNTQGKMVSPLIMSCLLNYSGVIQGQLIQETQNEYTLKLNATSEFKRELDLLNELKGYLGHQAIIHSVYVNEIPLLASGKRKMMVNKYTIK
ncbi:phenylacetate--CoA ligase family protein [Yeosuana marina]|uniref:CoF synthetase n=1 Tax=Yeosuana marina TaxID=1565536 RepID=UPI001F0E12AD|nr:CoF synthetase [Yeosuana marina]